MKILGIIFLGACVLVFISHYFGDLFDGQGFGNKDDQEQ